MAKPARRLRVRQALPEPRKPPYADHSAKAVPTGRVPVQMWAETRPSMA
jgi:hypothetical protein